MGLDISHGAWHGAYSAFMRWRVEIAHVAGFPPLELMEGFYFKKDSDPLVLLNYKYPNGDELDMSAIRRIEERWPIKWTLFEKHPLYELLTHSDCDGEISYGNCRKIATALEGLLPLLPDGEGGGHIGNWREKTQQFIDGCKRAYDAKEKIKFR